MQKHTSCVLLSVYYLQHTNVRRHWKNTEIHYQIQICYTTVEFFQRHRTEDNNGDEKLHKSST